ncbi:MAG TPA: hypothetical protein VJJ52_05570 [Candidatus Nanoarchaeia archaeon]|nr:hypothetical protein [Candidatus Nanoarchaeia archaeon]
MEELKAKIVSFRYSKQLVKTVHSDDSGFFARFLNLKYRMKRKSVPVYKIDVIIKVILGDKTEKRFNFSITDAAENIPFFDLNNGDGVILYFSKDNSLAKIKNLSNDTEYKLN